MLFPTVAVPFQIHTNRAQAFQFLHILANTCYFLFVVVFCVLFLDSHYLNGYEVVSHCGFDLYFPNHRDVQNLFMCLLSICIPSLEKRLFKSFAQILILFFFCS